MYVVGALGRLPMFGIELEAVTHVNAADDKHVFFCFDFASRFRDQPALSGRNVARLQRATKGASQSAGGGSDHVVEGGRMWIVDVCINAVMLGDLGMNAEESGILFPRKVSVTKRTFDPFYPHV